jgi:F-type H+-transporting ATPase subunit c
MTFYWRNLFMTDAGLRLVAAALAVGLGAIGPGVGIGIVVAGAVQSIARNPELEGTIRTNMFLGIVFAESLAILALVISFMIGFGVL